MKGSEQEPMEKKEYYTRNEFAELLGVTPVTVSRWISAGRIQVIRAVPHGKVTIPHTELERLTTNTPPAPVSTAKRGRKKKEENT